MSDAANTVPAEHQPSPGFDIHEIMRILPHRYPFLLIDRITEITRTKRIVAIKNVSVNEPYFVGHFPAGPIMPGVLVVEAMAQAGGVLLLIEFPDREHKLLLFTGIERAKFRRPGESRRPASYRGRCAGLAWQCRTHAGQSLHRRQGGVRGGHYLSATRPSRQASRDRAGCEIGSGAGLTLP